MKLAAGLLLALAALSAASQEPQEPALAFRSVVMFNQHLYYGTFKRPRGIAVDRQHNEVWVADSGNGIISVHRPDGGELYAFTSKQYATDPARITIAPKGRVAVLEGDRTHVRLFDYRGRYKGDLDIKALGEKPVIGAVAFDDQGNAYLGENRSHQVFVCRPDGTIKFQFGSAGSDEGQFESIGAIAVDADGTVYVMDQRALAVQAFDSEGNFLRGWGRHEMGGENFSLPSGLALDGKGHVLVADELRHSVKVFTTAGKYVAQFGGLGDGSGQLSFPTDVAVDGDGRIYVTERTTSRAQGFEPVLTAVTP